MTSKIYSQAETLRIIHNSDIYFDEKFFLEQNIPYMTKLKSLNVQMPPYR